MKTGRISIGLALGLGLAMGAHAEGLCESREAVIFNCELIKSVSSLCRSNDNHVLTYRNGSKGDLNLQISDERGGGVNFYFSSTPYSGGGESHIRFSRFHYTYYLYDKIVKSDDGPIFSAGIIIYKDDRKVANLFCKNDATIRESAYDTITRETYRSISDQ